MTLKHYNCSSGPKCVIVRYVTFDMLGFTLSMVFYVSKQNILVSLIFSPNWKQVLYLSSLTCLHRINRSVIHRLCLCTPAHLGGSSNIRYMLVYSLTHELCYTSHPCKPTLLYFLSGCGIFICITTHQKRDVLQTEASEEEDSWKTLSVGTYIFFPYLEYPNTLTKTRKSIHFVIQGRVFCNILKHRTHRVNKLMPDPRK